MLAFVKRDTLSIESWEGFSANAYCLFSFSDWGSRYTPSSFRGFLCTEGGGGGGFAGAVENGRWNGEFSSVCICN